MLIERYFEPGYVIWRLGIVQDEFENDVESWEQHSFATGRLRQLSGDRSYISEKWNVMVNARFYCPIETDIQEGDKLKDLEGQFYIVERVNNVMTMDRFLQVDVGRVAN